MRDDENKLVKSFGYKLGQVLAVVSVLCMISLMIGITIAILSRIL